jgi:hypothetical protein
MSFELAHKIKSKAGDSKTGTITKSSSFGNPHTNANLIKGSFNHILYLQRTIGNQAIMQPGRSENDNLTGFGFAGCQSSQR